MSSTFSPEAVVKRGQQLRAHVANKLASMSAEKSADKMLKVKNKALEGEVKYLEESLANLIHLKESLKNELLDTAKKSMSSSEYERFLEMFLVIPTMADIASGYKKPGLITAPEKLPRERNVQLRQAISIAEDRIDVCSQRMDEFLHLLQRNKTPVQVTVHQEGGADDKADNLILTVFPGNTVLTVKELIERQTGIPALQQTLYLQTSADCGGDEQAPIKDHTDLGTYSVTQGSVFKLVTPGTSWHCTKFTTAEISRLADAFQRVKVEGSDTINVAGGGGWISENGFCNLMKVLSKQRIFGLPRELEDNAICCTLFRMLTNSGGSAGGGSKSGGKKGKGKLYFGDYPLAVDKLVNGSPEVQLRLRFDLVDCERALKSDRICRQELVRQYAMIVDAELGFYEDLLDAHRAGKLCNKRECLEFFGCDECLKFLDTKNAGGSGGGGSGGSASSSGGGSSGGSAKEDDGTGISKRDVQMVEYALTALRFAQKKYERDATEIFTKLQQRARFRYGETPTLDSAPHGAPHGAPRVDTGAWAAAGEAAAARWDGRVKGGTTRPTSPPAPPPAPPPESVEAAEAVTDVAANRRAKDAAAAAAVAAANGTGDPGVEVDGEEQEAREEAKTAAAEEEQEQEKKKGEEEEEEAEEEAEEAEEEAEDSITWDQVRGCWEDAELAHTSGDILDGWGRPSGGARSSSGGERFSSGSPRCTTPRTPGVPDAETPNTTNRRKKAQEMVRIWETLETMLMPLQERAQGLNPKKAFALRVEARLVPEFQLVQLGGPEARKQLTEIQGSRIRAEQRHSRLKHV
jgi:uncharacterized membrane protein YgcG